MERQSKLKISEEVEPTIPEWIIWIQCSAFAILYAVWILPHVVGIRNTSLVIGSIFSLYVIYLHTDFFFKNKAIAIWLIIGVFIWATIHLVFFSQNYEPQLLEFKRIWRYVALGAIFATGLGISLAKTKNQNNWYLTYIGLCSPLILYVIKYLITHNEYIFDFEITSSLKITLTSADKFYIPKTDYLIFCLPAYAISLLIAFKSKIFKNKPLLFITSLLIIASTLFLFYQQNIKNGFIYAGLITILIIIKNIIKKNNKTKILMGLMVLVLYSAFLINHFNKNDSWKSFIADYKVAIDINQYDHWKYSGERGYPLNENGVQVSATNYERIAWIIIGTKLALENYLGYGLIEDSFKHLVLRKYQDASYKLSHSHSGIIDLYLGIGAIGVLLLFSSIIMIIKNSYAFSNERFEILVIICTILIPWMTTELSTFLGFKLLIFIICILAGYQISRKNV